MPQFKPLLALYSQLRTLRIPRAAIAMGVGALLVCALILGGAGAVAADHALPGDPMYSLKIALENVELALTTESDSHAQLELSLARTRIQELNALVESGRYDKISETTRAFALHVAHVTGAVHILFQTDPQRAASLAAREVSALSEFSTALALLSQKTPPNERAALEDALALVHSDRAIVQQQIAEHQPARANPLAPEAAPSAHGSTSVALQVLLSPNAPGATASATAAESESTDTTTSATRTESSKTSPKAIVRPKVAGTDVSASPSSVTELPAAEQQLVEKSNVNIKPGALQPNHDAPPSPIAQNVGPNFNRPEATPLPTSGVSKGKVTGPTRVTPTPSPCRTPSSRRAPGKVDPKLLCKPCDNSSVRLDSCKRDHNDRPDKPNSSAPGNDMPSRIHPVQLPMSLPTNKSLASRP